MPIPMIRVELDDDQVKRLEPIQEQVRQAAAIDAPGMILAHIYNGTARVFFANADQAKAIQAAMNSLVGRTTADLTTAPAYVQDAYT